jgi:hypothetical protein
MAEYLVLIYEDEAGYASGDETVINEVMEAHNKFGTNNAAALRGGNALQPTATATSIRTDASGQVTVTDGPFVESKEVLGGYYLIEADDLDAAIAIAKQTPARFGGIELRPIMTFG